MLEQRLPTNESAHEQVIADIRTRSEVGLRTYGRYLNTQSPEDMLQMAYEEALDLACYLKCEIEKRKLQQDSPPDKPSIARGQATKHYPVTDWWYVNLRDQFLVDYLASNPGQEFEVGNLREWIHATTKFRDCNKRISSAFKRLKSEELFYTPTRYTWRATAKWLTEKMDAIAEARLRQDIPAHIEIALEDIQAEIACYSCVEETERSYS